MEIFIEVDVRGWSFSILFGSSDTLSPGDSNVGTKVFCVCILRLTRIAGLLQVFTLNKLCPRLCH